MKEKQMSWPFFILTSLLDYILETKIISYPLWETFGELNQF